MKTNIFTLALLTFLFSQCNIMYGQKDNLIYIVNTAEWKPKDVKIEGDNNVIFYGDNIVLNRVEIPEEALKNIEDKYRKKLKSIRDKVSNQQIKLQQQNTEIAKLQADTKTAILSANDLYKNFLNIDFQKSSQKFKTAFDAFKNGQFEEAQRLIDDVQLELEDKKNADNRKFKANLHAIQFEFDKAKTNFEIAIRIYEDFNNLFDYAYFLLLQTDFQKAEDIFVKSIKFANADIQFAVVFSNLGMLTKKQNQYIKSIDFYSKSIPYFQKVLKSDPVYLAQIGTVLNNVGSLSIDMGQLADAQKILESALIIRESLYKLDAKVYSGEFVTTLMNIGLLYHKKYILDSALLYFQKALLINKERVKTDTLFTKSDLAKNYDYLGGLYQDKGNDKEAKFFYSEAVKIYSSLSKLNPEVYTNETAKVACNFGLFLHEIEQIDEAIFYLKQAKIIWESNKMINPALIEPNLGTVNHNLGLCFESKKEHDTALLYYKEALIIREKLLTNIQETQADFAQTLNCIGNILTDKESWKEALIAHQMALDKRKSLFEKNKEIYALDYTESLINMSLYNYSRLGVEKDIKFSEIALEYINEAIGILTPYPESRRKQSQLELAKNVLQVLKK